MANQQTYYKDRAEREIALAAATGARAGASVDFKRVFVQRPDGSEEVVRIPPPADSKKAKQH
jgi:hypothetical protein